MSVLDSPRRLYMMSEMVITATYGRPSAKYRVGTQAQGDFFIIESLKLLFVEALDLGTTIVVEKDLIVGLALLAHNGSAYLAEADAMTPAGTVEEESAVALLNLEGGGEQVALAEGATDFQLLADGEGLLRADNLQLPDASALATLQRDEVGDSAEVDVLLATDEL